MPVCKQPVELCNAGQRRVSTVSAGGLRQAPRDRGGNLSSNFEDVGSFTQGKKVEWG